MTVENAPEPEESTDSDDYTHVDPSEFEDFDRVDSTTIPPVSE